VDKLVRNLLHTYDSNLNVSDLSDEVKSLGEYILRDGDEKNELTFTEVKKRAVDIAKEIVDSAVTVDDSFYQQYRDLRDYARTVKFKVPKTMWADLEFVGGFNEFKKANMGRMNLSSTKGTSVDQLYMEMAEKWPEFFDPERTLNQVDMLVEISDVLNSIYDIQEYNPYSGEMEMAVEFIANDLLDGLMGEDVRQSPKTFADRQAAKLDEARARKAEAVQKERDRREAQVEQIRAKAAETIQRAREQNEEKIQRLKEHYAQQRKAQTAARADSEARTRLLNIVRRLKNKKLPAVTRELLNQYIGDIDTVSKSLTGKSVQDLTALRDWYNEQKRNDPDFIPDPRIEEQLERLSKRKTWLLHQRRDGTGH
jgi:uncharacterized protein YwgA